ATPSRRPGSTYVAYRQLLAPSPAREHIRASHAHGSRNLRGSGHWSLAQVSIILRAMSPPSLRRYRAERLLREEFELQRARVLASVYARLRAAGIRLDEGDLDACYALAWHGLYAALLEGQHVASPTGWLALVTYRRAIDEH